MTLFFWCNRKMITPRINPQLGVEQKLSFCGATSPTSPDEVKDLIFFFFFFNKENIFFEKWKKMFSFRRN